jgi:hypothetical protein
VEKVRVREKAKAKVASPNKSQKTFRNEQNCKSKIYSLNHLQILQKEDIMRQIVGSNSLKNAPKMTMLVKRSNGEILPKTKTPKIPSKKGKRNLMLLIPRTPPPTKGLESIC